MVLCLGAVFVWSIASGSLQAPPEDVQPFYFSTKGGLLSYSFIATLCSIIFCALCAPILILFIYINFEKTQSQECVYCIAFLLTCLTESTRLLIPVLNLWHTNTSLFIAITRLVFFGRLLAPMSFFVCAITSGNSEYQESGKYFTLLAALAGVFSVLIPVNTLHIRANCSVDFGFSRFVVLFQIILCLITFFSFLFVAKTYSKKESLFLTAGYILFFSGYCVLTFADSFFFAIVGAVCFVVGMRLYLGAIHKIYMWD